MKNKVKFIGKAKVTKQGQVTLPYEGRRELNIELESEVDSFLADPNSEEVAYLCHKIRRISILIKRNVEIV